GRAAGAAGDHEDRVVAGDRPYHFGQRRAVERLGERLRLATARADDDELLDALDTAQKFTGGALEQRHRRLRAARLGARALIGAVARALHEAEFLDVARDRRLRHLEAALVQPSREQLLAVQRLPVDHLEDQRLAACFHAGTKREYTSISVDPNRRAVYKYS